MANPIQQSEIMIHTGDDCPPPVELDRNWYGNMYEVDDDCILGWGNITVEFTTYVTPAGKSDMAYSDFKTVQVPFCNGARPMTKSRLMGLMLDEYLSLAKEHIRDFPRSQSFDPLPCPFKFIWGLRRCGDVYRPIIG